MTATTVYGVEWQGDGDPFIAGGYTLNGARAMLAAAGDVKANRPHAVRVMRCETSAWVPVDGPAQDGAA